MKRTFSHRVGLIKPSPIFAVTAKANALKAQGIDIISLGAGEPDFDTPDSIKTAAIQAIQQGLTKYTPVEGTLSLRRAIIKKFEQDNHPRYAPNEILVSTGAKQSIYNLIQALINPGDEVIIPAPYWVSYPDMVLLGEGKPVILPTSIDAHFKITAEQLEAAITPKTRLIILNSPSNPTGVSYSADELRSLTTVLQRYPQVWIATDDIYEYIRWSSEPFCNVLTVDPSLQSRTVVIHGVSKTYAMTGWRIGYAAGPSDLIEAMTNIQSQSTSNPCSVSQAAAEAALTGDQQTVDEMVHAFKLRHDYIVKALNQIKGISCLPADGAFYLFPNCQAIIDKMPDIRDDVALAEYLIQTARVALVPGSAFGSPGYLRLSFASSMPLLETSIARLNQALSGL